MVANSPSDGAVDLYVLMDDGTIATTEIKNAVLSACNDDTVRPLTDKVSVKDPQKVSYNITLHLLCAEGQLPQLHRDQGCGRQGRG